MATAKQMCSHCGQEKKTTDDFYVSNSIIHNYNNRLPVCKMCLIEIYEEFFNESKSENVALYRLCRTLDVYYEDKLYEVAKKQSSSKNTGLVPAYFQKVNSLNQYKGKVFEETIGGETEIKYQEGNDDDENIEVSIEVKRFWGMGYSNSEYKFLQKYYDDLDTFYENKTPIQHTIYKDLSVNELRKIKSNNPSDSKKYIDIQSALMNDANIKPIQDKGDDSLSTWGLWVKKIEMEEPIPEASDEFKDIDGIVGYIQKFFVNHMSRIFGIKEDDLDQEEMDVKNGNFITKSGDDNAIT